MASDYQQICSVGKAARILGVNRGTLASWIRKGLVAGGKTPTGQNAISIDELKRLLAEMSGNPIEMEDLADALAS